MSKHYNQYKEEKKMRLDNDKGFFAAFGIMGFIAVLFNLLFWGGLLWLGFFLFDKYVG